MGAVGGHFVIEFVFGSRFPNSSILSLYLRGAKPQCAPHRLLVNPNRNPCL
jgi:hypothetical protein